MGRTEYNVRTFLSYMPTFEQLLDLNKHQLVTRVQLHRSCTASQNTMFALMPFASTFQSDLELRKKESQRRGYCFQALLCL